MAERNGLFSLDQIEERYDKLEKEMLKEFYEFVERHERFIWLHWNMRDINYGFPAIAHRYSVLGGKPIVVDEDKLYDLARILYAKYGSNYIEHPRMESITKLNNISNKDALSGIDEAEAFKNKEYLKLHRSTLRKVDIIASLAEREWDGTLKTKATRRDMYGVSLAAWTEAITEHWIFKLFGVIGVGFVLAIISFIISLIR